MSIKLGNNNADKLYIDNHPIREIIYGDKIRYLRNDYSKNYFDVTNYETSRWEMDNKPNEYVVHLDKYIGNYENVIVPTDMYDTSHHDSWQLTIRRLAYSRSGECKIFTDTEKEDLITSVTFTQNRESTEEVHTVTITGYNTIYLWSNTNGQDGIENMSITGGTFVPDDEYTPCGATITKQSNSVVFSYYVD